MPYSSRLLAKIVMQPMRSLSRALLLLFICMGSGVNAQQRPVPPSIEGCRAYLQQVIAQLRTSGARSTSCMKKTSPRIEYHVQVCNSRTHMLQDGYTAWGQCFEEANECRLLNAQDDAYSCMREARQHATETQKNQLALESLNKAESAVREARSNFSDVKSAWNDPKRFMREKVASRLQAGVMPDLEDSRGRFTKRGETLTQETYDFLFKRTIGNQDLYASNPIIGAIQGSTADEIRRAHREAIYLMEQLPKMASDQSIPPAWKSETTDFIPQPPPRPVASGPSRGADDCAILDGPQRADLAMDEPERFEALVRRCQSSRRR